MACRENDIKQLKEYERHVSAKSAVTWSSLRPILVAL